MERKKSLLLTATRIAELQHLSKSTGSPVVAEFFPNSGVWAFEVHPKGLSKSSEFKGDFVEAIDQAIDFLGNHDIYS